MAEKYILGETLPAVVTLTFDGTPTAADTITAKAIDPSGTQTSITPVGEPQAAPETGKYRADFTTPGNGKPGIWRIRVTAQIGSVVQIEELLYTVSA